MGSHSQAVMSLWETLRPERPLEVLDLSAGEGKTTRHLLRLGHRVTATNFGPERGDIPSEATYISLDLNRALPFPDASFDGVNLKDVLEHLESPAHVFREVARVLRMGGVFVFSTPNILNVSSRLRMLATGYHEGRKRPVSYAKAPGDAANIYIPPFHLIHYLLAHSGLRLEASASGRREPAAWLVGIPLYPLFWLGAHLATRHARPQDLLSRADRHGAEPEQLEALRRRQMRIQRELRRWLVSPDLLLGRNLILRARKVESQGIAIFD